MVLFCLKKWLDNHIIRRWKYNFRMKKIITGGKPPWFCNAELKNTGEMNVYDTQLLGYNYELPTVATKQELIQEYGPDKLVSSAEEANLAIWIRYNTSKKSAVYTVYIRLANNYWYTLNELLFFEKITIYLEEPKEWIFFKV